MLQTIVGGDCSIFFVRQLRLTLRNIGEHGEWKILILLDYEWSTDIISMLESKTPRNTTNLGWRLIGNCAVWLDEVIAFTSYCCPNYQIKFLFLGVNIGSNASRWECARTSRHYIVSMLKSWWFIARIGAISSYNIHLLKELIDQCIWTWWHFRDVDDLLDFLCLDQKCL